MNTLATWVFGVLVTLRPPAQNDVPRLRELVIISIVIADASEATPLPRKTVHETASQLIQIGHLESGFAIHAVGKMGELGVWQLMPPAPLRLREQATEALRRWRVQGPEGYTGEGRCPCPLADHRRFGAALIAAAFAP
jgi:hypothetical protein